MTIRPANHALMEAQGVVGERIQRLVLGVLQRGQAGHDRTPRREVADVRGQP